CCGAGNVRLFGWRRSSRRFNVWEVAQPCRKRGEKESNCTDTRLHCCRPENLFENLRVIFLTGKDDPAVRSQALAAGASAFFLKGEPNEEFLAGIQAAIPWS